MSRPAYEKAIEFVRFLGGEMEYKAGGENGGGTWIIGLHGRTIKIRVSDHHATVLDELYVPKRLPARETRDYTNELTEDAFWRLVKLFTG